MGALKRLPRSQPTTRILPSSQDKSPIGRDFRVEQFFENGFPFPVKVTLRNGFAVTLPAHGNPITSNLVTTRVYDFVVRVKYHYSVSVKIDTNNVLDVASNASNKELEAMYLAVSHANPQFAGSVHDFSVDYHVTRDDFDRAGEAGLHIPEVDVVITRADVCDVVHPYSPEGLALIAHESGDLTGYLYRIEIVDPYDKFGHRFVNIAGKVDRVQPVNDLRREPGVYIHRVLRTDHTKPADIKPEYYTFEDAIKFVKLYRTEDEALAHGDLAEERKREFETTIHDLKLKAVTRESELKEETARHKKLELEFEEKMRELKETRDVLATLREERVEKLKEEHTKREYVRKEQHEERKDHYEARSYARKDDSEWLKWIPAVIVGGGLLAYKLFWEK